MPAAKYTGPTADWETRGPGRIIPVRPRCEIRDLPALRWNCSPFAELELDLLYDLLRLRAEVFVVEQDCAYQDLDGYDRQSLHLCGTEAGKLACYARITPPGIKLRCAAISRVLVSEPHRGDGIGRLLMREALSRCEQRWPEAEIGLSAQQHLAGFYASLGFQAVSAPYDDEGIPHIDMLRGVRRPA